MSQTPISIGIIGYRGFGAFCTEAFHASGAGRVAAYAGRDARAMAETARRYGVSRTYTDWRALIADPDVELVHIVTPPNLHAEMAIASLQAGKHVLIEKPLAISDEEARAILAAAHESGKIAGINYVMRYDPLYQMVGRIAQEGWLGALTHVGFENYASDEGIENNHWFWDKAQSGGIFVEHGVHFFDIIGSIIAAPAKSVTAQTWTRGDGTGKEDRVQAIVTYENEVEASYYHAFNRPGALEKQTAHFAFERGHITLSGWIPTTLQMDALVTEDTAHVLGEMGFTAISKTKFTQDSVRGNGKTYQVAQRLKAAQTIGEPTPVYQAAVQDVLKDLAQAIRDPTHTPLVSATDGLTSLRVALAAVRAAATGQAQGL